MAGEPRTIPSLLQDRYRLGPPIGRGGASIVLRARDELLSRDVAVKVFTARASDAADLKAQETEARMLAGLNHHGLVTLLDAGIDASDPDSPRVYLVLELVDGPDLRQRLRSGPLTPVDAAYLGFDLTGAIGYVHEHGILHRDVKPANVLLTPGGDRLRAKLADFGIAMLRRSDAAPEEQTTGTAAYLSPEQVEGQPLGPASDVYSLGLVVLEALTGRPAYSGPLVDTALARLDHDPEVPAGLPADLTAIVRAMTARQPVDRPTPAEAELAFRTVLVGALAHGPRPDDEQARLRALRRYDLLDTPPDGAFDRITAMAARLTRSPIALVGLTEHDRIWFKSRIGVEAEQLPLPIPGTAAGGVLRRTTVLVDEGDGAVMLPPALARLGVRTFAGVPLVTEDGHAVGLLAVCDRRPRAVTSADVALLEDLAALVVHEMELRRAVHRIVARD